MNNMFNNYPDDMRQSDWEYLEGECYCEKCGIKLDNADDCVEIACHIYCEACYNEEYGDEEC